MTHHPLNYFTRISVLSAGTAILAALSCAVPASCGPSQLIQNLRAGQSQIIVTYGTSLTRPAEWPHQLGAWLTTEFPGQAQVISRGIPSMASQHENDFFDGLARLEALVLSQNPDTVFLEFAVNDALPGNNISPQQSRANLNTMIDRILADGPDREIILMTMSPAWDPPNDLTASLARPNLAEYYQGYREVAEQRGLLLIDHYSNWIELRDSNPSLFKEYIPDGVHPTSDALLQVVTPVIIQALTVPEPAITTLTALGVTAVIGSQRRRRPMLRIAGYAKSS